MSSTKESSSEPMLVGFSAINPYIEENIVLPTEVSAAGHRWVSWGEKNNYPDYLFGLYQSVPTLTSVINGTKDFVCGDECQFTSPYFANEVNREGLLVEDLVDALAMSWLTYGGLAVQVIRDADGNPCELYPLDMRYLRMNKDCNVFYYSEKWNKGARDCVVYPKYLHDLNWNALTDEEKSRHASSIIFKKFSVSQTYPMPLYASAVKSCEIEKCIDIFQLNSVNNGFVSSFIVNFNNGIPTDKQKEEIEKNFTEKFTGAQNAGRVMFSWNRDKDNAASIEKVDVPDFGEKYKSMAERSKQQIFTAFRANPNLFGIPTENNGFSNEEYAESFKLYNKTMVRPIQKVLINALSPLGVLTIVPFSFE